jgi:hypothetical protein
VVTGLALVSTACGDDSAGQLSRQRGDAGPGHVNLTFSGAVDGRVDAPAEVACFPPVEAGQPFTVSIDPEPGGTGEGPRLTALDFSIPEYDGPGHYDLAEAVSDEGLQTDDFLLLFEELETAPFRWGEGEGPPPGPGTVTVDREVTSGRLVLEGWENPEGDRVDLQGTFRCGRRPEVPQP